MCTTWCFLSPAVEASTNTYCGGGVSSDPGQSSSRREGNAQQLPSLWYPRKGSPSSLGVDEGATLCVKPGKHGSIRPCPSDSEPGEGAPNPFISLRRATKGATSGWLCGNSSDDRAHCPTERRESPLYQIVETPGTFITGRAGHCAPSGYDSGSITRTGLIQLSR